jgi:hypothetical protein
MTNIKIIDAIFLQRVRQLRLVSDVELHGEKIVFSLHADSLEHAKEILKVLDEPIQIDAQLIDGGLVNIPVDQLPASANPVIESLDEEKYNATSLALDEASKRVSGYSIDARKALSYADGFIDRNSPKT